MDAGDWTLEGNKDRNEKGWDVGQVVAVVILRAQFETIRLNEVREGSSLRGE